MENDFGSWFRHQISDRQSPNLNAMGTPFDIGLQNTIPAHMSPCPNVLLTKENAPVFPFSGVPHFNAGQQLNEPQGWFYCLPRFRQAFTPAPSSIFKEKLSSGPNPEAGCAQKRFLVFDQSGDQTTLMFTPGVGSSPVQCATTFGPKLDSAFDLNNVGLGTKRETRLHLEPILTCEYYENKKDDTGSEMYHEDTEEINALLYSDDDEYDDDGVSSEDDEVASTGHSPCGMTDDGKQELLEESEEVASSKGPTKRRKLFDGGCEVEPLMDTATSVKSKICFDLEDDAESSCANSKNKGLGKFGSLSGNKRSRKDKIRETVDILQSIIPGGEGKDAIRILDEAIDYLRSLKYKAKALGVDTL
ncbi:transcription factor bHLH143-like [Rhododendron vialii]|uniref:transcription factor bHLH143-like n=1 Tax=Rhododendron vialii TaxID=182163 RepID=UPI00265DDDEE|nr:transcription factor bHLH143-like [Rhododendron vialii]XP_058221299.1 transcription factor bHLH143-like [Rhododendron vialii]